MPLQPILYLGALALNAANDQSASSFFDLRTQQPVNAGGLNLGDYFDLTEALALQNSDNAVGLLHYGRYRRIQVDANAVAANIVKGFGAYIVPGYSLPAVTLPAGFIVTAGSGQTAGTYTAAASGGGGTGAQISYTISAAGTLLAIPTVLTPGSGYTSTPTFTIAAGGTPATFVATMVQNADIVTDFTHAVTPTQAPKGIFLNSAALPITPGNFGYIQESGLATLQWSSTVGTVAVGCWANALTPGSFTGTAATSSPTGITTGYALDLPAASQLVRAIIGVSPQWLE